MNTLKRIVDISLYLSFCILAGGGLMLKYSFVKGMGPQTVLGLTKPDWEFIHFCVAIFMIFALIVHLFLNKKFLSTVIFCKKRILLCAFLFVGIFFAFLLALYPTKFSKNLDDGKHQGQQMRGK